MKEIKELSLAPEGTYINYGDDFDEPLLEYVASIAEEYKPITPEDFETGCIVSKAINDFIYRYFNNRLDKSFLSKYLDNTDVQQTIKALGYDVDKFWYLLLFIYDYSSGFCKKGIKPNDAPKDQIMRLINGITDNLKPANLDLDFFNEPTKIVLETKGKRKITIDNSLAIYWLASTCFHALEEVKDGSQMATSITKVKFLESGYFENDSLSDSKHIWYFAEMFFKFFELETPTKTVIKNGSSISYNKMLLVSRLILIVGLSENENFSYSDDTLKGFLKQYKDYKPDRINGIYL